MNIDTRLRDMPDTSDMPDTPDTPDTPDMSDDLADAGAQFVRIGGDTRKSVPFVLDGQPAEALEGDTVLTAILVQRRRLRVTEFSGEPRAGFCLIGACQDCWIRTEDGRRLRSCTTRIERDMRVVTGSGRGTMLPLPPGSAAR